MSKIDPTRLRAVELTMTVEATISRTFRITFIAWKPLMACPSPTR